MLNRSMAGVLLVILGIASFTCGDVTNEERDMGVEDERDYRIFFRRRTFTPPADFEAFIDSDRKHGLLQLYETPRNREAIEDLGIEIHGAQPNHSYYVSVREDVTSADLRSIAARALFSMEPLDRVSPRLIPRGESEPDGTGDVRIVMQFVVQTPRDEFDAALQASNAVLLDLDTERGWATLRIPRARILSLANEQWV